MIDIDIELLFLHPVKKLLVSIKHSSYIINLYYKFFRQIFFILQFFLKKQIYMKKIKNKKPRRLCLLIRTCFIFLVLFSKNSQFHCRRQPFRKGCVVEDELDGIDLDDIGNLEDSPRLVFIDEEYGNLIVVNDGRGLNRNINQKKKSDVLQSLD